jgi:hypothetical protein
MRNNQSETGSDSCGISSGRQRRRTVWACLIMLGLGGSASAVFDGPDDGSAARSQPRQPAYGPGSSEYLHARLRMTTHGQGARKYWLFTPEEPTPDHAPVVVFLHGWGTLTPDPYMAWIRHLVRRGNCVVFPRYQDGLGTLPNSFVGHASSAIRDAVSRLQSEGPVQPDLDRFALMGHSMGAIMSANIAQNCERLNVPTPRSIFLAEPTFEPILGHYDQIAPETLIVVVVGADVKRDSSAQKILTESVRVPRSNKNFVALHSDPRGNPPLISDHFAPCAVDESDPSHAKSARDQWQGRTCDALDYFGYWKICDGTLDAGFGAGHREFALGDTPEIRFMGTWSDGTPIEPAIVLPIEDTAETAGR